MAQQEGPQIPPTQVVVQAVKEGYRYEEFCRPSQMWLQLTRDSWAFDMALNRVFGNLLGMRRGAQEREVLGPQVQVLQQVTAQERPEAQE